MKIDLARYVPPGSDLKPETRVFGWGMALSTLFSMVFLAELFHERADLYRKAGSEMILKTGAFMPDFVEILHPFLLGFPILALCMAAFIPVHYACFYRDSKSIYLMRRLPSRWELHRRCLTVPMCAVLCCLAAALVLLLIYFAVYMLATPENCLRPGQWQKIWSVRI